MRSFLIGASAVVTAFVCTLLMATPPSVQIPAAQIELPCPPGTQPVQGVGQTFNNSTGKFRQYQCVDNNGNMKFSNVSIDYVSGSTPAITITNSNGSGGNQMSGPGWNISQNGAISVTAGGQSVSGSALIATGGPFNVAASSVSYGSGQGFGNGTAGTSVTTTTLGTGTGPANPQTIVNYLQIRAGSTTYWIPLVQ